MAEFTVYATVTVSAHTVVEADNAEHALEIAKGRSAAIGGNGSGNDPDEHFVIEDADGEPENLRVD